MSVAEHLQHRNPVCEKLHYYEEEHLASALRLLPASNCTDCEQRHDRPGPRGSSTGHRELGG